MISSDGSVQGHEHCHANANHRRSLPCRHGSRRALRKTPSTNGAVGVKSNTEADIQANGRVTASEKFKGLKAGHDLKPKTGEKICPVTLTKANPEFPWAVGGKAYEFCCPPCVDEFVALAKEKPSEVLDPETYRKK